METMFLIREYKESAHLAGVQACIIELQDSERSLDPRMPPGAAIVNDYIPRMQHRCRMCDGKIFVAELNEEIVGFATILAKVTSDEIEDGDIEYGLISDLVVASPFRKQGIGRKLLETAEAYARSRGVKWLRVGVLAANDLADGLYDSMGFEKLYVEREKTLIES